MCSVGKLYIFEGGCFKDYFCIGRREPKNLLSMTNLVLIYIEIKAPFNAPYFVSFEVVSTAGTDYSKIFVNWTSSHSGYLLSPGYSRINGFKSCVNDSYKLIVPKHHVLVVTFDDYVYTIDSPFWDLSYREKDCSPDSSVSIYAYDEGRGLGRLLWRECRFAKVYSDTPFIFNTSVAIHLRATASIDLNAETLRGTKMFFSLHPEVLRIQESGRWNCSTSEYFTFSHHLRCNLRIECEDGRDENQCPHRSAVCNGSFRFKNKCYAYRHDTGERLNTSNNVCHKSGSSIVGVRTPSDFEAVKTLMSDTPVRLWRKVFVGLRPSSPRLPVYYRHAVQNMDGSINYLVPVAGGVGTGDCQFLSPGLAGVDSVSCECGKQWGSQCTLICESPVPYNVSTPDLTDCREGVSGRCSPQPAAGPPAPVAATLSLSSSPKNWASLSNSTTMLRCRRGHVTYDFLSCDFVTGQGEIVGCFFFFFLD